jgi:hypothetical protein
MRSPCVGCRVWSSLGGGAAWSSLGDGARYAGTAGEGRKVFFSEEKKQKTFDTLGVCAAWEVRDGIKQKRFLASFAATPTVRRLK